MLQGAVLYGGLVYVLSGPGSSKRPEEYQDQPLEDF